MIISSRSIPVAVLAQKAESLGFESLWLPEHPVILVHTTSRHQGSADGAIPAFMRDLVDPFIGLAQVTELERIAERVFS
jgi:alkanesulfonate monooxygenase SsuD/methylene tetrahydromethanopterin reductase-like flavin-dependent oxidoreductase (luciferase family)